MVGVGVEGLIPACAGKTKARFTAPTNRGAHPRVCGENLRWVDKAELFLGSSPRVRGKPGGEVYDAGGGGLIPACAGKTSRIGSQRRTCRAHPRVCGENWAENSPSGGFHGSSPRVRGKQTRHSRGRLQVGLIPACAGKTSDPPISPLSHRAHPRVCGENAIARAAGPGFEGSSPRVRGKHRFGVGIRTERGLIPACAGKTSRRISIYANTSGSSPRVRGKPTLAAQSR